MDDVRRAIDEIGRHGERARFLGAAEPAVIDAAERELGLRFPPSYRAFLERLGPGSFYYELTAGIFADDRPGAPSAVWATARAREQLGLPPQYVLIQKHDDSSALAIDCGSPGPDGECPVVRLWPGETEHLVDSTVADSFGSCFADCVREQIETFEDRDD